MFKLLLKKQFFEFFSSIFIDKRKTKKKTVGGIIFTTILYIFLFGVIGINVYLGANQLCEPLVSANLAWFYFTLFGLLALLFGVIGSAFSTYNAIYVAKDNDMLFSMPIKPRIILNSRLVSVYLLSLLYVMLLFIPASIAYISNSSPVFTEILLVIITPFMLAILSSAISCLLGWIISLIARIIKNKSFFTVLSALLFLGAYYYFYFKSSTILQKILEMPALIANTLQGYIYPFYLMGAGAAGDTIKFLLFALICLVAGAIVYFIISTGFSRAITSVGNAPSVRRNAKYASKNIKVRSASSALFKKELLRFTSSSNYMLNANLGLVFMLAASVALFIKGSELREILTSQLSVHNDTLALWVCGIVSMLSSSNITTASSISLEGKHIWLPQSLPLDSKLILLAKLKLHLALILLPLAILIAAVIIVFQFPFLHALIICVVSVLFVAVMAMLGLLMNLKWANLHWTNEVVPIKQSLPTLLALFGGFVIILLLAAGHSLIADFVEPFAYMCIIAAILGAACLTLYRLIVTWGAIRFTELS